MMPARKRKTTDFTNPSRPLNEAQRLASEENFAIFQLKGMLGNLNAVFKVDEFSFSLLKLELKDAIKRIQHRQELRNPKLTAKRAKKKTKAAELIAEFDKANKK